MEQLLPKITKMPLQRIDTDVEKIIICGHDLIELSKKHQYLDVVHLLLEGELPSSTERAGVKELLQTNYHIPVDVTTLLKLLPKKT